MSKLFIRVPPSFATTATSGGGVPECPFALVSDLHVVVQQGSLPLADIRDLVAQAEQVILLLPASDVTLLHMAVPPLSRAKLKAALPYLVEDRLICDPQHCVIVAGPPQSGMRTIAVIQRDLLESVAQNFLSMGARSLRAYPAQLFLPLEAGMVSAAICRYGEQYELQVRLSEWDGMGLAILPEHEEATIEEAVNMLDNLIPDRAIWLTVAESEIQRCSTLLSTREFNFRVTPQTWTDGIIDVQTNKLDLITGLDVAASGCGIRWYLWRRPLLLASVLLLVNVVALNVDWWLSLHSSRELKSSMFDAYRNAYPKDTLIIDPLAQVRQKIELAHRAQGRSAPDDFLALTAQYNAALSNIQTKMGKATMLSLKYRDHSLIVRLANSSDGDSLKEQLQRLLAGKGLVLSSAEDGLWRIKVNEGGDK